MNLIPPNQFQIEAIKKQVFYKPPQIIDEDVTQLIEWLTKQSHLPIINDRKWLSHFIISCKYNLQKSKKIIESYFIVRAKYQEFFGPINEENITEIMNHGFAYFIPNLDQENNRIFCISTHPKHHDSNYNAIFVVTLLLSILDLQLNIEAIHGTIFLVDLEHFQMSQLLEYTPTITKNAFTCAIDSFPMRVKAIHCINPPKFIGRIMMFFKMFLPNKLKERIIIHDSLETLYEHVSKDILPDVYGGAGGSAEKYKQNMVNYLLKNNEWLLARPKADLSRMTQSKSDELDMNGTFRKLQID